MTRHGTKVCHCCGREIARRNVGGGKALHRHKCPHGHWCVAGDRLDGHHANQPRCRECLNIKRAKDGLPPVEKRILGESRKAT
jgi:hypothetical protein